VWVYSPASHKNAHRGHDRKIYLGPRAQTVLRPWLRTKLDDYLFQPKEAMDAHRAVRAENRKTPLSCGNRPGTNRQRHPRRQPSDRYNTTAYARSITRGCEAAGVPSWTPNRLRHNAGTWLRREFGLDVARVILGHRSPAVTEIYAEVDEAKAIQVMAKVG
jgi:integrase